VQGGPTSGLCWSGVRPTVRGSAMNPIVRGSAMNPVDHPHGSGEGRAPIVLGRPLTPWGLPAYSKRDDPL